MRLFLFILFFSKTLFAQVAVGDPSETTIGAKEQKTEFAFLNAMKFYLTENHDKAASEFKSILSNFGENASVFYMLSKSENILTKYAESLINAKKAYELDNSNYFYLQNYIDLLVKNQNYSDAISSIKKLIKLKPLVSNNYFILTDLLLTEGKETEVLKTFGEMEKIFGPTEEITQKKQLLLLKNNKIDAALKEGTKFIKKEPEYLIQQAQIMLQNNKTAEALELLNKSLEENPYFFDAYALLSDVFLNQKNKEKNQALLERAIAQDNMPPNIKNKIISNQLLILGKSLIEAELTNQLIFIDQIINQHPTEARSYIIKADLLVKNKNLLNARDTYLIAIKNDYSTFETWMAIVEIDTKLGLIDDLIKHTEKALELFPNQGFLWYHNGFGHKLKKNFDEAILAFEEARNLADQNIDLKNHINANLGDLYQELKLYDKSELAYETVLKSNPTSEHALNNYSLFLASRKKDLAKSIKLIETLLAKHPKNSDFLDTKAFILFQMGDFTQANSIINLALTNTTNPSSNILEHKGDIEFKLGQKENANEYWKKAFLKNPTNKILERKTKEGILIE